MKKEYSIEERSSGHWVTDGNGTVEGPFDNLKLANECKTALETAIEHEDWRAELRGKVLTISKDGEQRTYSIRQKNNGIEHDKAFPEYFMIKTDGFNYHFKFEVDNFFVGDKFSKDGEHIDSFASHVFGEEV